MRIYRRKPLTLATAAFSLFVSLLLVLSGCAATEAPEVVEVAEVDEHVGPAEGFQSPENFDPDDVASIRESRDAWVTAFAEGDAEALRFVFNQDAALDLPADIAAMSGEEFFAKYDAELVLDESSEQYITDGGDPRTMTKLPWVSFYSNYNLTLTPKTDGEAMENSGRFMTRFHRQDDDSLAVSRSPLVGDPAPLFTLNEMKQGESIALADTTGEKPTVLVFGSYT